MITRIEAIRYRCFERLGVDLGNYHVIVGANGSGKTTLLDIPVLFGALLRADNVSTPFMFGQEETPPRAGSLGELVFSGRGCDFSLAVEAKLPDDIKTRILQGMIVRLNSENAQRALLNDPKRRPSHIRYEITLRVFNNRALQVVNEYLFVFPDEHGPDRKLGGFHGALAEDNRHWLLILKRELGYEVELHTEVPSAKGKRAQSVKFVIPDIQLAMGRVMYEGDAEYPSSRWLFNTLTQQTVFLDPNWAKMRLASPPGLPKKIMPSGRNIPWLALHLKRDGAPEGEVNGYRSERYDDWVRHVRTALPQLADIDVREREDDHHAYFRITYRGGYEVPHSGLSDGTLRILTLTLLPYLPDPPLILVTEEPENGIHPQAIESVLQSLSSLYDSQVWVSSHSPVVLGSTEINQLLCARLTSAHGVQMVSGPEHPRLLHWRRGTDLGLLLAAGVLG